MAIKLQIISQVSLNSKARKTANRGSHCKGCIKGVQIHHSYFQIGNIINMFNISGHRIGINIELRYKIVVQQNST